MAFRTSNNKGSVPASLMMPRIILLISAFVLVLLGCVMIYSASTISALAAGVSPFNNLRDQLIYAAIGIIGALVIWKVIPGFLWRYDTVVWAVLGLVVVLLLVTAIFGTEVNGAKRWLSIAGKTIQPSEFAKIAFVLMAVRTMDLYTQGNLDRRSLIVYGGGGIVLPLMLLFFSQSDLGTTVICLVGVLGVLWLGGISFRVIGSIVAFIAVMVVAVIIFGAGYRSDRFLYLDPWNDGSEGMGAGYQMVHSYYAIADGGLFGVGLGGSKEKFLYLPEAETDYIFAIICEELGLLGALVVILLFLAILYAGLQVARQAPDLFGSMLAGSFAIILVAQAFLNIGCVIGVFPTTGKPLPFISSGGSSLISSMMMVGFILSVSEDAAAPSVFERRRDDLTLIHNHANDSLLAEKRFSREGNPRSRVDRGALGGVFPRERDSRSNSPELLGKHRRRVSVMRSRAQDPSDERANRHETLRRSPSRPSVYEAPLSLRNIHSGETERWRNHRF